MSTNNWRSKLFQIIYHSDTPSGKWFDLILIGSILLSVLVVMLDSEQELNQQYEQIFDTLEWSFTILFSIEYIVRILCIRRPSVYIFSFFGVVDLISILPTYLGLFFAGSEYLLVVRILRILRIFRILKLTHYMGQADMLIKALLGARQKVIVFLAFLFTLVSIFGALMYLVEGPENGFTSIPRGMYWAIITVTTVGYGDLVPHTPLGQTIASFMVILGYSIIAVPTGILTAEFSEQIRHELKSSGPSCQVCGFTTSDAKAQYCSQCGASHEFIEP